MILSKLKSLFGSKRDEIFSFISQIKIELLENIGTQKSNIERMIASSNEKIIREVGVQKENLERAIASSNELLIESAQGQTKDLQQSIASSNEKIIREVGVQKENLERAIASSNELLIESAQGQTKDLQQSIASSNEKIIREVGVQKENLERAIASSNELLIESAQGQTKDLQQSIASSNEKIIREVGVQKENLEKLIGASNEYIVGNIGIQKENLEAAVVNLHNYVKEVADDHINSDMVELLFRANEVRYVNGEKIKIYFLFQAPSFWPSIHTLWNACVSDRRIEAKMIVHTRPSYMNPQMKSAEKFLSDLDIPYELYTDIELSKSLPHIFVYQSPYDQSHRTKAYWVDRMKSKGVRIVYVTYGIEIAANPRGIYDQFQMPAIQNFWKIYTYSDRMKKQYRMYASRLVDNVVSIGHPKFDLIRPDTNLPSKSSMIKNKKVLLWKVHFIKRISNTIDEPALQCTPALDIYINFAKILNRYSGILFIFMPHPMFFTEIFTGEDKKKVEELISLLKSAENCLIDEDPDYRPSLMIADGFITDRTGMLVEMGLLDKPILYLRNLVHEEPLSPPVEEIVSTYEQGTSIEDIETFINNFEKNIDLRKKERNAVIRNQITISKKSSFGALIKEDIIKSFLFEKGLL